MPRPKLPKPQKIEPLECLKFDEKTRCHTCGLPIKWGEPYGVTKYTGDTACSACCDEPIWRNGEVSDTDAACAILKRENVFLTHKMLAITQKWEDVDAAYLALKELVEGCDICPSEIKFAYERMKKVYEAYPDENYLKYDL